VGTGKWSACLGCMPESFMPPCFVSNTTLPLLTSVALQGASKPPMTDVGAAPPQHKEQQEPLLPSGKRSSPATGFVPDSVLGASSAKDQPRAGDIEHVRALFVPRSLLSAGPCQPMLICP